MNRITLRCLLCAVAALHGTNQLAAAPGDLDCGFGTGGVLTADLGGTEAAYDAELTSNGAVLILNSDLRVTRITSGGAIDTSFGTGGSVTPSIPNAVGAFDLAVDSQGRIVIAGRRTDGDDEIFVARLTPAGVLDASFGGGDGWIGFEWSADTATTGIERVGEVLIASGDRPVVVGSYDPNGNIFNPSNANIAVARLTDAGVLDPGFGNGGIGIASSAGLVDDDARGGAIDANGRILTIGAFTPSSGPRNTIVTRWNTNGALDGTFASGGIAIIDGSAAGTDDFGISMTIDGANRPVLLSQGTDDPILMRLTTAGSLDPTFDTDGIVQRSFLGGQDVVERVLVQSDGRILVTGWPVVGFTFRFASMRFLDNGQLDTTWGGTGVVTTIVGGNMRAYSALLTANNRLLMAGGLNNDTQIVLTRYLTDGTTLLTPTMSFSGQSPNPSLRTDPATFSLLVTASGVTPAGSVQISDGVDSCTAVLSSVTPGSATGSCAIAFTTAGTRNVTASYDGGGVVCRASVATQQFVRFRVTPTAGAGGSINPSTVQGVAPGGTTSFTLTPNASHVIRDVIGCGGARQGSTYTTGPISADCTVAATFNAIPQAQAGVLTVLEDSGANSGQLAAIDDGDPLTFSIVTPPSRGAIGLNPTTGAYTYTPGPDANGNDSFQFSASDGTSASTATVSVTITAVNDAPTVTGASNIVLPVGSSGAQSVAGFAGFDAGPADEDATQTIADFLIGPISDPSGVLVAGSLDVANDGTLSYTLTGNPGQATISLRVRDSGGTSNGGVDVSAAVNFTIERAGAAGSDVSVTLVDSPDPVSIGAQLTYVATLSSNGPGDADNAQIRFPIPTPTTLVSASASAGGSCSGSPVVCTWPGSTAPGEARIATIIVAVPLNASGSISATATVNASNDGNASNNSASASTVVSRRRIVPGP